MLAGLQVLAVKLVVVLGSKVVVVTTMESQPNWLTNTWVVAPTFAGLQVVFAKLVVLPGDNVVVVTTVESQPN